MPVNNANSLDPDQMLRSVASDLDLHCLSVSLLWDARLKWVNKKHGYFTYFCVNICCGHSVEESHIYFHVEIRKIIYECSIISGVMICL